MDAREIYLRAQLRKHERSARKIRAELNRIAAEKREEFLKRFSGKSYAEIKVWDIFPRRVASALWDQKLKHAGGDTLDHLLKCTRIDLLKCRGIGRKTLDEIVDTLAGLGVCLAHTEGELSVISALVCAAGTR